ncbi:acylphosphatase [Falsibacillus albus]|uniref:Acylphosphatase n=1 Tax=Falsibacillus albus TaxID=2478915 RepID=A0A3L7JXD7_9BACI|nr:acylphosphatase [Falsibacillus albus]RLQ95426.1 acylphosphatase [Falsibacillus albus]
MIKSANIFVTGKVQGVGFRFTVQKIAMENGLYGWVKNLGDGSVEVFVQGDEKVIYPFIDKLKDNPTPFSKVRDVQWTWKATEKEFSSFDILY